MRVIETAHPANKIECIDRTDNFRPIFVNIFQGVNTTVSITQKEAFWLREHGRGMDVHMSSITKKSRGKNYFATESPKTMAMLNKLRSDIISTYEGTK